MFMKGMPSLKPAQLYASQTLAGYWLFFFFTSQASSFQMQQCAVMVKKTASWYEMFLMVYHIVGGV